MALSDNNTRREQESTKNRSLYNADKKWWSDRQKLECVQTYLVTGNAAMTGRLLKIPEDTVRRWKQSQWWKDIEEDLRLQDNLMTTARMKKIIEKTFDVVEDRLEHGDWVYDTKKGELVRKGVAAKDAHRIGLDLLKERDKMLGREFEPVNSEAVDDKLAKLASHFADMVNKRIQPPAEVVDVQVKETSGSAQGGSTPFQGDEQEFESPDPLQDNSSL